MDLAALKRWLATPTGIGLVVATILLAAGFIDGPHRIASGIVGALFTGALVGKSLRRTAATPAAGVDDLRSDIAALQRQLDGDYAGIDAVDASVLAVSERIARMETEIARLGVPGRQP